jgi:tripartite-type tricarboxylate transporter receptor subunit TctC
MRVAVRALMSLLLAAATGAAFAQTWPAKPAKMIVSTGPGLATDTVARLLCDRLSRDLGQQFVVENIAGAGGIIAAQATARAAPDGYTYMFTGGGALITNIFAFKSLPYDPARDFTPVSMVTESGGFVIAINPELAVKTLAELIALAKAQPGKLSYAVDTSNIYVGILGKLLNKTAGIDLVEIPYKSSAQAIQDTVAGRTQIYISSAASVEAVAQAGKLRRISVSSTKRTPGLPDLPTMAETLPGFQIDGGGFMVVAPAGTPSDIVHRLNRAIAPILKSPDFQKRMLSIGQVAAAGAGSPEEMGQYLRSDRERWGKIFRDLNIQPQ